MKKRELVCNHYKGEGYFYDLIGSILLICKKCNVKLLREMKEQEKLEKSLKPMRLKRTLCLN